MGGGEPLEIFEQVNVNDENHLLEKLMQSGWER